MNVKKIIELIEATPALADDAAALLTMLNAKGTKKAQSVARPVGSVGKPTSIADEHGGEATKDDVDAAIALIEKKKKVKP